MTKSLTTRVGSLSRARPLLTPFDILLLNNDNTLNNHVHARFRLHMRKNGAGGAPGRRHAHTTRSHATRNDGRTRAVRRIHPQMVL